MWIKETTIPNLSGPWLRFLCLAALFGFMVAAPQMAMANCACDDGYCESVSRAYFEFGDAITESCTFTADVTRPAGKTGNGFTINGPDIVVDGSDFCLDGVSTANATVGTNGIFANSYYGSHNGTIKNLEIKNFWQGIKLRGGSGAISGWLIDDCEVHDNGELGYDAKYEGIWLDVAEDCTVQNCTIYNNNQGSGIANGESDYNTFTNNEIYGNYKHGIKAWWDSWYLTASDNYVHDNGWGGDQPQERIQLWHHRVQHLHQQHRSRDSGRRHGQLVSRQYQHGQRQLH